MKVKGRKSTRSSVRKLNIICKIYAEYERFMNGHVDWAKFIAKVYEAFDNKVNAMIAEALSTAPTKVKPAGRFTATLDLTSSDDQKDAIIELIDDLGSLTGNEVVLMGTKTALNHLTKLADANWIAEADKMDRRTLGRLAMWEGVRLVEIPQVFNGNSTTDKLISNKQILVMPSGDNKFIKMYDEGDAMIKDVEDPTVNMDMTMEYEYLQKMGVGVVAAKKFGVINVITA